jgi:hypothetical protein
MGLAYNYLSLMQLAHMVASNSSLTTQYPIFHVYEWGWGNNLHVIDCGDRGPNIRLMWVEVLLVSASKDLLHVKSSSWASL